MHGSLARLVRLVVMCLAAALAAGPEALALAQGQPGADITIGTSQGGEALVVHHVGTGPTRLFILGGQHGRPEANTVALADALLAYFQEHADEIPPALGIDVLSPANPDGLASGSRQFLSGVDPDRNWGGPDWAADAWDSNAQFRVGLGGPEPFSEPETKALADYLLATRPAFVVNYHSAGGFVLGGRAGPGGDLADAFASASGYRRPAPGGPSPLPYRATGSMNVWMGSVGLPGILVELTTPQAVELDRNLAGIQAILARLAGV